MLPTKQCQRVVAKLGQIFSIDQHFAAIGMNEGGHQVKQRTFSRATRTHDGKELTLVDP